jgi:hypothetical protein
MHVGSARVANGIITNTVAKIPKINWSVTKILPHMALDLLGPEAHFQFKVLNVTNRIFLGEVSG